MILHLRFRTLLVVTACLATSASAAELSQSTSLFQKANVASKQLQILDAGAAVQVTGTSISQDGLNWTPVTADGKAGFIMSSAIAPDSNHSAPPSTAAVHAPSHIRLWIAEGIATINSYTNYIGNDFSFGAAMGVGKDHRLSIGFSGEGLGSAEFSSDSQILGIHRHSVFVDLGYELLPESLYVLVHGGVCGVGVDSTTSTLLAQWIYGASVGMPVVQQGHLGLAVQLNYTYTPSVSTSSTPIIGGISTAFGFPSGTISAASVVSLQLVLNFTP